MANKEKTGKRAASVASKVLRDSNSSKSAKTAAGSALSQRGSTTKVTSAKAASAASKTLRNPGTSKSDKVSAGSALTQKPGRRGK